MLKIVTVKNGKKFPDNTVTYTVTCCKKAQEIPQSQIDNLK